MRDAGLLTPGIGRRRPGRRPRGPRARRGRGRVVARSKRGRSPAPGTGDAGARRSRRASLPTTPTRGRRRPSRSRWPPPRREIPSSRSSTRQGRRRRRPPRRRPPGLTSQDVLDTALVLVAKDAADATHRSLARGGRVAHVGWPASTASTPALARTLSQAALPTTFGARVAGWLQALAEADGRLARRAPRTSPSPTAARLARSTASPRGGRGRGRLRRRRRLGAGARASRHRRRRGTSPASPSSALAPPSPRSAPRSARSRPTCWSPHAPRSGELREHAAPGKGDVLHHALQGEPRPVHHDCAAPRWRRPTSSLRCLCRGRARRRRAPRRRVARRVGGPARPRAPRGHRVAVRGEPRRWPGDRRGRGRRATSPPTARRTTDVGRAAQIVDRVLDAYGYGDVTPMTRSASIRGVAFAVRDASPAAARARPVPRHLREPLWRDVIAPADPRPSTSSAGTSPATATPPTSTAPAADGEVTIARLAAEVADVA